MYVQYVHGEHCFCMTRAKRVQKWRSIERLYAPSIVCKYNCKCNVNRTHNLEEERDSESCSRSPILLQLVPFPESERFCSHAFVSSRDRRRPSQSVQRFQHAREYPSIWWHTSLPSWDLKRSKNVCLRSVEHSYLHFKRRRWLVSAWWRTGVLI